MANIPKISNNLVIFGAIAVAALVIPGTLGPLAFQQAYADHRGNSQDNEQSNRASQTADDTLVNVQAQVQANADVDISDVNVCVIVEECD